MVFEFAFIWFDLYYPFSSQPPKYKINTQKISIILNNLYHDFYNHIVVSFSFEVQYPLTAKIGGRADRKLINFFRIKIFFSDYAGFEIFVHFLKT